jgi:glycosyltransferase involved in cell wall biosynthesis
MIALIDVPPPIHGMSNINKKMYELFVSEGLKPKLIDTSPKYLGRFYNTKLWPIIKIVHSMKVMLLLIIILIKSHDKVVYRAINGGKGQVIDLLYILICALFNCKIYIHHHSFAYLDKKTKLFKIICLILKNKAHHIVLGNKMKICLADLYDIDYSFVYVLSNSVFFKKLDDGCNNKIVAHDNTSDMIVLGYLANISIDKGIDVFSLLCTSLRANKINIVALVAGPINDKDARTIVDDMSKENHAEYLGPIYGHEKYDFYRSLDFFIFPSKYRNEAEPLVLYEAAQVGTLVVGSEAGCMKEIIENINGISHALTKNSIDEYITYITNEIISNIYTKKYEAKKSRIDKFDDFKKSYNNTLYKIIEDLKNV